MTSIISLTQGILILESISGVLASIECPYEFEPEEFVRFDRFYKLPTVVKPLAYHIGLHYDQELKLGPFKGTVEIIVQSSESTDEIVLHWGPTLEFRNSCSIVDEDQKHFDAPQLDFGLDKKQIVTIKLNNKTLSPGKNYTLRIDYTWKILRGELGPYQDKSNGYHLITQFQPKHFRFLCPGFDEPHFKATFSIEIWLPKRPASECLQPRSNMLLNLTSERDESSDQRGYVFETTPLMSPYLLALTIFDKRRLNLVTVKNTDQNLSAEVIGHFPPSKLKRIGNTWLQSLEIVERFIDIPLVLRDTRISFVEKQRFAGMENWGHIIVSVDNPGVYLHEAIHQWFGNLVTMRDTENLWINEGVTSFLSRLLLPKLQEITSSNEPPNQDHYEFETLIGNSKSMVQELGYLPLSGEINNCYFPDDLPTHTYSKGSAFYHMLRKMMGAKRFKILLKQFIEKNRYGSLDSPAVLDLILPHLDSSNGSNTGIERRFLNGFVYQSHYPVVNVKCSQTEDKKYRVEFSQECVSSEIGRCGSRWAIPLFLHSNGSNGHRALQDEFKKSGSVGGGYLWLEENATVSIELPLGKQDSESNKSSSHGYSWNHNCFGSYFVNDTCSDNPVATNDLDYYCGMFHVLGLSIHSKDEYNIKKASNFIENLVNDTNINSWKTVSHFSLPETKSLYLPDELMEKLEATIPIGQLDTQLDFGGPGPPPPPQEIF